MLRFRYHWVPTLLLVATAIATAGASIYYFQGVPRSFWRQYQTAEVRFDNNGIPTMEAKEWAQLLEAQGFVVASDRLWQMDLLRRQAGGRLSAWFGKRTLDSDLAKVREDRLGVAERAVPLLAANERADCDAFAKGVNAFIEAFPYRWGLEYLVLGTRPEPWQCRDSLLIIQSMAEALTSGAPLEAEQSVWRRALSPAWEKLLFSDYHPWAEPLFGQVSAAEFNVPPPAEWFPAEPLPPPEQKSGSVFFDEPAFGSNNWVWSRAQETFLANDPHLPYSVPGIWYANRMRRNSSDWVVGTSIPGIPGIILGMNSHIAWAFTNSGEDVDDYLQLEVREADMYYRTSPAGAAASDWAPLEKREFLLEVRGQAPETVTTWYSPFGPVQRQPALANAWYARQWLALRPEMLRLPSRQLAEAADWDDFNAAIDAMVLPSQNILYADHKGQLGYRLSGIGVRRAVSGRWPQPAATGAWLGYAPMAERPRLLLPAKAEGAAQWLATANARVFVDQFGHHFQSEDRSERIRSLLRTDAPLSQVNMAAMQRDTMSRFRKLLLDWVAEHAQAKSGPALAITNRWLAWNGDEGANSSIFAEAKFVEDQLMQVLLGRVQKRFFANGTAPSPYHHQLRRGWLTALLERSPSFASFGIDDNELASYLVESVRAHAPLAPHAESNRWQTQHPLAAIPVLGWLFRISEPAQAGDLDVLGVATPDFGASARLIWNLNDPSQSSWSFPVGQSGHAASPYYANFRQRWGQGLSVPVLASGHNWELHTRTGNTVSAYCPTPFGPGKCTLPH